MNLHAHKPEYAGLEAVMRFHAVKRWHMIDTTRVQTLAEHSANVALLAYYITITAPGIYFGSASDAAAAGLIHDLPEVFIGDMPTPVKKHINGMQALEDRVLPSAFRQLGPRNPYLESLIKLCDLADGIRFIRIHGVDITATHACDVLKEQIDNLMARCIEQWPQEVANHVKDCVYFYAYEFS